MIVPPGEITVVPWYQDIPERHEYQTFDHWVDDMQYHNGHELAIARRDGDEAYIECVECDVTIARLNT